MATGALDKSPDVAGRRERLVSLCQGLRGWPRCRPVRGGHDAPG